MPQDPAEVYFINFVSLELSMSSVRPATVGARDNLRGKERPGLLTQPPPPPPEGL